MKFLKQLPCPLFIKQLWCKIMTGHNPQPFGKGQVVTCRYCGLRQYGGDK